jgi:hypothetical protein
MADDRWADLRELLDDATIQPWRIENPNAQGWDDDVVIVNGDNNYVCQTSYDTLSSTTDNSVEDAELIVYLRNFAPDLLAERDRLAAEVAARDRVICTLVDRVRSGGPSNITDDWLADRYFGTDAPALAAALSEEADHG